MYPALAVLTEHNAQTADGEAMERDRDAQEIQRLRGQCRSLEDELEASLANSRSIGDREVWSIILFSLLEA